MFLEFHLSTVNLEKEWFNFKLPPPPSFRIFESLMNGKYKMISIPNEQEFDVEIPNFKLHSKFTQN